VEGLSANLAEAEATIADLETDRAALREKLEEKDEETTQLQSDLEVAKVVNANLQPGSDDRATRDGGDDGSASSTTASDEGEEEDALMREAEEMHTEQEGTMEDGPDGYASQQPHEQADEQATWQEESAPAPDPHILRDPTVERPSVRLSVRQAGGEAVQVDGDEAVQMVAAMVEKHQVAEDVLAIAHEKVRALQSFHAKQEQQLSRQLKEQKHSQRSKLQAKLEARRRQRAAEAERTRLDAEEAEKRAEANRQAEIEEKKQLEELERQLEAQAAMERERQRRAQAQSLKELEDQVKRSVAVHVDGERQLQESLAERRRLERDKLKAKLAMRKKERNRMQTARENVHPDADGACSTTLGEAKDDSDGQGLQDEPLEENEEALLDMQVEKAVAKEEQELQQARLNNLAMQLSTFTDELIGSDSTTKVGDGGDTQTSSSVPSLSREADEHGYRVFSHMVQVLQMERQDMEQALTRERSALQNTKRLLGQATQDLIVLLQRNEELEARIQCAQTSGRDETEKR